MDLVEEGKEDYVKILRELYDQILAVKVEEKP
jgi:reverse gyrase